MTRNGPSRKNLNRNLVKKYLVGTSTLSTDSDSTEGKVLQGEEGYFFKPSENDGRLYKLFTKSIEGDETGIRLELVRVPDLDYIHKPKYKRIKGEIRRERNV